MKLTTQIKLSPSQKQHAKLLQTVERTNEACDCISGQAWDDGTFSQYGIHKLVYYAARARFERSAQMTVRAIAKVADAYKTTPHPRNSFSIRGGFPYDSRVLTDHLDNGEVSIWTLGGRERIPTTMGKRQRRLMQSQQGESDLVYHDGAFYLLATCNVEEPDPEDVDEALGVDFGIENIATDSDGEAHSGAAIDAKRDWYEKRRAILQSVGTRSAGRRPQQLSGGEKADRRSQSAFVCSQSAFVCSQSAVVCPSCGHNQNADRNAAVNSVARALVNASMVASEASGSSSADIAASSGRRAAA